jgi:hypothetical protein
MIAAIEQARREYDPKREAAEQAEHDALAARYPGQFVAYLDGWDGERLTRHVLAASESLSEFHRQLGEHPDYEARRTEVVVTQVRDPHGGLWAHSLWIESIEPQPEEADAPSIVPAL